MPSLILSITPISSSGVKYRSHTWENMSITPHDVRKRDKEQVSSGFINAITGLTSGWLTSSFFPSSVLFTTVTALDSLPVAGQVRITPTGREDSGTAAPVKKSHTSPLITAPNPIAFAESITLPPPIAITKSTSSFFAISIPSYTRDSLGFGNTPPSSTQDIPSFSKFLLILSNNPVAYKNSPLSWWISTLFTPLFFNSDPIWFCAFFPNTNCVWIQMLKSWSILCTFL